jgi:hypothetical protein
MRSLLILLAVSHCAFAAATDCRATSGAQTAAFVELYTSEGCSSCPPADRWLSGFAGTRHDPRVVPVAFHVHYWDYIGWKDSFGEARQRMSVVAFLQDTETGEVLQALSASCR